MEETDSESDSEDDKLRETDNCARLQSADLDNVDCGLSLSS